MVLEQTLGVSSRTEDLVAAFRIEGEPVRGRIARLGIGTLDPILKRHDYDTELARLLGEALMLAALVGSAMKFQGRVLVQAEGNGPISLLAAEYTVTGELRGYVRRDPEKWAKLMRINKGARPHMPQLFGAKGVLGLIIIHDDPSMKPYQGVVPLEKGTMAECAEEYFRRSEQVESRISLAVGELSVPGGATEWRGGGILLQQVAGDDARGDTDEAWETASALFATVGDAELIAPDVSPGQLLYRLFHETGVRMAEPQALTDACSCNEERLRGTLQGLSDDGLRDLVEPDGTLSINCQFCNRHYKIPIADVTGKANA
ncbi:MAG: Hsp33 family molecular chaperone HslO [Pseudomonadota bacterium]